MPRIEDLYQAAAGAGLLVLVTIGEEELLAEFTAPDEELFDGMGVSCDYAIRYPASFLPPLRRGDRLEIATMPYEVREVRAIGDGSERRATLTRL